MKCRKCQGKMFYIDDPANLRYACINCGMISYINDKSNKQLKRDGYFAKLNITASNS